MHSSINILKTRISHFLRNIFSLKSSEKVYSSFCCVVAFGKQLALGLFVFVYFSVRIHPASISWVFFFILGLKTNKQRLHFQTPNDSTGFIVQMVSICFLHCLLPGKRVWNRSAGSKFTVQKKIPSFYLSSVLSFKITSLNFMSISGKMLSCINDSIW